MDESLEPLEGLALSRGVLDRREHLRREPRLLARALCASQTKVLELADGRARTCRVDGSLRLVLRPPGTRDSDQLALWLGRDEQGCDYVALVYDDPLSDERPAMSSKGWRTLREAGSDLDATEAGAFTTALALAQWHSRHMHCPRCGARTEIEEGGWLRRCSADGSEHHPRTDPAIIVAVTDRENRLLLARAAHWPTKRMSVLAGFVEAGESLEAAVTREVSEEVGLDVTQLSYQGNQPWPFPGSLMVGYRAVADSSDITIDQEEIVQAAWYSRGEISWAVRNGDVALPPRVSIARRLIEGWFGDEIAEPPPESSGYAV